MTSRPTLGVQQRQPQRSLSGSGLPQRPPHQRTLSQHLPPSPIRKEAFLDFGSPDPNDAAVARNGMLRRGGSRLKLELSNDMMAHDGLSGSPGALDSSRPGVITPSRIMPADLGDMSPRPSTQGTDGDSARLPMPRRHKRFTVPVPRRNPPNVASSAAPVKKDGTPKAWSVETPPEAPHYTKPGRIESQARSAPAGAGHGASNGHTKGYADFFPWVGKHPEDAFSENVIRQGFFDKAPNAAQTETSSAKLALFPVLKHKNGPQMLSQIFTSVLVGRKHKGQINPESQFRLPPRVTVTDNRRQAWLNDLANPEIPLRKLSRTIPHGVRGKVFFDQCLSKNIPIDRAIWMAKCCGSQDLRSFKRKGGGGAFVMSGEAKWIRDWTVCIEQFVETRVIAFGEADWKAKVNYAIRLATNLFAEHLLDREHYLEWLLSNLENSGHAKIPMWILLTQIYWDDLLALRRSGKRLIASLLSHYLTVQNHSDKDVLQPLSSRLASLLRTLLVRSPESFIAPTIWSKYRDVVNSTLSLDDTAARLAWKTINRRNEQLMTTNACSQPAARNILVKQLDSALRTPMSDTLLEDCWNITSDKAALVKTVLEWCTSLYRPGLAKIYITARLFSSWGSLGVDVGAAVLGFLDAVPLPEQERRDAFFHLVSELVRLNLFGPSHYLQWLIARGGLSDPSEVNPEGPAATRLVVELPLHTMSTSLRSLRASVLRRVRYDVDLERQDAEVALRHLQHTLGFPLDANDPILGRKPISVAKLATLVRKSGRGLKTGLGAWLEDNFAKLARLGGKEVLDIPLATFEAVRAILEATEDYRMLAQVLKMATGMSNVEVLGSCADTVNLHVTTFAALGVARGIFDTLLGRLRPLVELHGVGARPLLAALSNLAPRIPGLEELSLQLHKDLTRSDRSTAVDACSPVSDNMAMRLQETEGELHEEIEKLLSGGTSLDKNTMERLFGNVVSGLQGAWAKRDTSQRAYSILLTRLRLFDPQHFDAIMTKWLVRVRVSTDRPSVLYIFPVLICLESLSISTVLSTASDESASSAAAARTESGPSVVQHTWRSRYIQEVLQLFTTPLAQHPLLTAEERYRFAIKQSQAHKTHTNELLALIRNSLAEYSVCRQHGATDLPLDDQRTRRHILALLQSLVLMDPTPVARALTVKNADPAVAGLIESTTTKLLLPSSPEGAQISFAQVLELTDEFTLPFCQLKLSSSLALGDSSGPEASERMQSHLELFVKAMDNAVDAKNITWTGMLTSLSPEITQHLKNSAQARFFEVLPSAKTAPSQGPALERSVQMAENLLSIVEAIIRGGSMGRPPQLVPAMVDKLADVWEVLASGDAPARRAVLHHWLPAMLTFFTLHTAAFDASKASNEVRARSAVVLAGLLLELDALPADAVADGAVVTAVTATATALGARIFDLALLLVDSLADDARAACARVLARETAADPRLRYLFSHAPNPAENLMLSHRDKPTPSPGGATGAPRSVGGGGGVAAVAVLHPPAERLSRFVFRRWEIFSDPNPTVQENGSSLNLTLFEAIKL